MKQPRKIKVPANVFQGLEAVRKSGTTNMLEWRVATAQAVALGYLDTAQWIESNLEAYERGIFQGFEAMN